MTGYDEKRVLYMLCDDVNRYGEREMSYDLFYYVFVLYISKLVDRQKANTLLFKLLMNDKYIIESIYKELLDKAMEIYNDWCFTKYILIKSDMKNDKLDFNKLSRLSKFAL